MWKCQHCGTYTKDKPCPNGCCEQHGCLEDCSIFVLPVDIEVCMLQGVRDMLNIFPQEQ